MQWVQPGGITAHELVFFLHEGLVSVIMASRGNDNMVSLWSLPLNKHHGSHELGCLCLVRVW